jgi:hypothetical protein
MTTTASRTLFAAPALDVFAVGARKRFEGFIKAGQEQVQTHIDATVAATRDQVETASARMLKSYDEAAVFSKSNVEALLQAGAIAGEGAGTIGKEVVACARSSMDATLAAGKAALSASSPAQLADVHSAFLKASLDAWFGQAVRVSELSMTVTREALAPLGARLNAALESLSRPVAA